MYIPTHDVILNRWWRFVLCRTFSPQNNAINWTYVFDEASKIRGAHFQNSQTENFSQTHIKIRFSPDSKMPGTIHNNRMKAVTVWIIHFKCAVIFFQTPSPQIPVSDNGAFSFALPSRSSLYPPTYLLPLLFLEVYIYTKYIL